MQATSLVFYEIAERPPKLDQRELIKHSLQNLRLAIISAVSTSTDSVKIVLIAPAGPSIAALTLA